ncbi:type I restriction endonuclease subunit R, EcoR124 family [Arthrobacter alpinus]|uniref:type I restriction endonuclease subunit R, EcoR124 family n=1 Tax=Arthrobacter alpinus TaxID=656366 RepID=UPI001C95313D|nr:hypothetical protein [Arthrobacter alpinus]
MTPGVKEQQRAELHKTIWQIASDLRGSYIATQREKELAKIISAENLKSEETGRFLDGALCTTGTATTKVLPAVSRFSKDKNHSAQKQYVIEKLGVFFELFFGLGSHGDNR